MEGKETRCIVIGRSRAGKTSLCQRINNEELRYHKTQTLQLFGNTLIDTPGEYLELRRYWGNIVTAAADADILLLVQDATEKVTAFPAAYASNFMKPAVGVITKCDLADVEQVERARAYLQTAGVETIFQTSSVSGDGVDTLMEFIRKANNQSDDCDSDSLISMRGEKL